MRTVQQRSSISGGPKTHRAELDVLDLLEEFGRTVTVRRGHEIYRHNDPTEFCWKILSGCVRTVKQMEDGRRQIDEFLWPGDLLGMDDLETYCADAEAVNTVTLRRYPRTMLEAQAKCDAALAFRLRAMALANLREAHKQTILLGRKTAAERVASFLLDMERRSRTANGLLVELPMNRTDIADHLGLSIETVCRNLVHLQREGTVAILRSGVELRDRAALQELACEPER
jgi:CRP/FNR family transcriptional regulator, nitrogen fixation regulation protein